MDYEFRYYDEKYLQRQFEIGNKKMLTWLGAQQSSVDKLKHAYSKPGTDPETKMYALKDGTVVGFLTSGLSGKTASMSLPLVEDGEEECADRLLEFAFDTMRRKGIEQIQVNASPGWGKTMSFVERFQFDLDEVQWYSARLDVDNFKLELIETTAQDVLEADHKEIVELLMDDREMTAAEARGQVNKLQDIEDRVLSWKIIRQNGKIVAHDHLVQDIRDSSKARMNAIFSQSKEHRDQIMIEHVRAAKQADVQFIDNFFFGPSLDKSDLYLPYGFEITHVSRFVKNL